MLASAIGAVTDTFAYDAFGSLASRSGTTPIQHLYRGEQLDPNLGFYNLRARWMDPESGRFTQIDPFPGINRLPSSLHGYTYVANDPLNQSDPTGMTNLVELQMGQSQNTIRASTPTVSQKALDIARKTKIWDVFTYQVIWPWHSYMFLEKKGAGGRGLRYDVGAEGGWPSIWRARLATVDGFVRAGWSRRSVLEGRGIRVAKFTLGQQLLWHATVVGTDEPTCTLPLDYNMVTGPNCTSWTVWATAKAIFISRLSI
jgi:RHS repeat-associated protein